MNERHILVITKLVTTNLGNEALSAELIRLTNSRRDGWTASFAGRPRGLERYTMESLPAGAERAVDWFESEVDQLESGYARVRALARRAARALGEGEPTVSVVRAAADTSLPERIGRLISKATSGRAWPMFRCAPTYYLRLARIELAGAVAYSAAGEIMDHAILLRQLLELGLALRLGAALYPINQSVDVRDPRLVAILARVYGRAARIAVRGERSREFLERLGIDAGRITVAPDTAFLCDPPVPPVPRERAAAVAINGVYGADLDGWARIVRALDELGYPVTFVSNDGWYDQRIAEQLAKTVSIDVSGVATDYRDYVRGLGRFEILVSNRLHTAVFAMIAGTPVVPIEGSVSKTHDVFELFDYPLPVVDTTSSDWPDRAIANIRQAHDTAAQLRQRIATRCAEFRERAVHNAVWSDQAAAPSSRPNTGPSAKSSS